MQIALDVVDLLQLQEIWSKRPIVMAFTRLEDRPAAVLSPINFSIEELLPRLARLKQSSAWQVKSKHLNADPARVPLADFSEAYFSEMYPEASSPAEQRQSLFNSVYARFIVAHYRGSVEQTGAALQTLARVRDMEQEERLGEDALPLPGSPEWIPFNITDEIRGLDERYDPIEPGTPAAYVVSDQFWPLLVKVLPAEIEETVRIQCSPDKMEFAEPLHQALLAMTEIAYTWNRSPSVVGLCYQISD